MTTPSCSLGEGVCDDLLLAENLLVALVVYEAESVTYGGEAEIGVVGAEEEAVLGAGCHEAVRLAMVHRGEIVGHDADVGEVAGEDKRAVGADVFDEC